MTDLTQRCVIVTGAAQGIGAAYARAFATAGAQVALVDRENCQGVADEIAAAGGRARRFICDLADPAAITAAAGQILEWRAAPIVLLNNAGIYPVTPLKTLSLEQWRSTFAINVEAPLLLSLALIPAMKADGWGRIINIASSIVTLPRTGVAAYTASKMAVIGMTRAFASDLGGFGITVNAISPGLTRTPGTAGQLADFGRDDMFDEFAKAQPIRRVIEATDMTGLACFLATDASAMLSGQTLLVDGGLCRL